MPMLKVRYISRHEHADGPVKRKTGALPGILLICADDRTEDPGMLSMNPPPVLDDKLDLEAPHTWRAQT